MPGRPVFHGLFMLVSFPFRLIFSNRRKIAGALLVTLVFVLFSSFSFPYDARGEEDSEEEEPKAVYVDSDEGMIVVEEIGEEPLKEDYYRSETAIYGENPGELEVSANDVFLAMSNVSAGEKRIDNDFQADLNARIFDEEKGYVKASYKDDWSLILINRDHPIPIDYEFELATIRGNVESDTRVMPYVMEMINAAWQDGVKLYICSPFRSDERQEMLFKRKQKSYMKQGYTEEEAYNLASQTIAIPGTSEHQVGLAFDFISSDYKHLDAGFKDTRAGRWLKKNGAKYGFILRYPEGKEDITGIEFEPWHYRFVGQKAAEEIMDRGICLEEYAAEIGAVE